MNRVAVLAVATVLLALGIDSKVRVHVVPHSHDDVGWLKTPEQYFFGQNNSIQHAEVKLIYDSVVQSLSEHPDRKFSVVEVFFFSKWFELQTAEVQETVHRLVRAEQLQFVNGGWVMHDEATTYYRDIVDQMTLGHRYLYDKFSARPSEGWQIDPFGHSQGQVMLFSQGAGFNATYHSRIDYQDFSHRQKTQSREFYWAPSPSLGSNAAVFASSMLHSTYCPQYTLNFDILLETNSIACDVPQTGASNDDEGTCSTSNPESWVNRVRRLLASDMAVTAGNDVMLTMGCDFTYMQARKWYDSMDQLMEVFNNDDFSEFELVYSTPREYAAAKVASGAIPAKKEEDVKVGDFLPYADGPHMFWTGFYTSRPTFKRLVREASRFYGAVRQLVWQLRYGSDKATSQWGKGNTPVDLFDLADALGVAQHHDAITGTAKQHVSFEYTRRLAAGMNTTVVSLSAALNRLGLNGTLSHCPLANVSICPPLSRVAEATLIVYNPLPVKRTSILHIPSRSPTVSAINVASGSRLPASSYTSASVSDYSRTCSCNALPYTAAIEVELEPLQVTTLMFSAFEPSEGDKSKERPVPPAQGTVVETEVLRLEFDAETGMLINFFNKKDNVRRNVTQAWCFYNSSIGDDESWQPSGAYIFRPNSSECEPVSLVATLRVVSEPSSPEIVIEQTFADWVTQWIRVSLSSTVVDFEFTVGPIPLPLDSSYGAAGKEVVMRFLTSVDSADTFATDANGLEMVKRHRNTRPFPFVQTEEVAGNYYPVTTAAQIQDDEAELTVFTDATVGAASLRSGELELMVHRAVLKDDRRGVAEPLNETEHIEPYVNCEWKKEWHNSNPCGAHFGRQLLVRGVFRLTLTAVAKKTNWRDTATALQQSPQWFVLERPTDALATPYDAAMAAGDFFNSAIPSSSLVVPPGVELVTLEALNATTTLLRLANPKSCDSSASCTDGMIEVNMKQLLPAAKSIVRTTLTANAPLTTDAFTGSRMVDEVSGLKRPAGTFKDGKATLYPMELHTFLVQM